VNHIEVFGVGCMRASILEVLHPYPGTATRARRTPLNCEELQSHLHAISEPGTSTNVLAGLTRATYRALATNDGYGIAVHILSPTKRSIGAAK